MQSECPTEWEPGQPGTTALWQSNPVCGIQPWSPNSVAYEVGDIVSFGGSLFQCIQPHTSQAAWDPPDTAALWQPFDPNQGAPGASGDVTQVTPILDCVATTAGIFTAVFGYDNESGGTVIAPIGPTNEFSGAPLGRGQPISFLSGKHDGTFVVDFDGNALSWTLGGQTVTASGSSKKCLATEGPDGPVVDVGGTPILLHPDPGLIVPGSVVGTETDADGNTVGALPGDFQVTGDGAAAYSIPLWTPPARMGMGPRIALSYSSRAEMGLAGFGWTVSGYGISRITRCEKTVAQDGDTAPIKFLGDDVFCLDGTRLLPTADTGNGMAVYFPEHDSFTEVIFNTQTQSFRVLERDGRVLTYGTTDASRHVGTLLFFNNDLPPGTPPSLVPAIYAWGLDSVTDATGSNTMEITWQHAVDDPGPLSTVPCTEFLPSTISYTGPNPTRSVSFVYEKGAQRCRYVSGMGLGSQYRLKNIQMSGPGPTGQSQLLRSYNLLYMPGGLPVGTTSGRALLELVQECDAAGACMLPTSFVYEPGSQQFDQLDVVGSIPTIPSTQTNNHHAAEGFDNLVFTDLNGDGLDDALYFRVSYTCIPVPHVVFCPTDSPVLKWAFSLNQGGQFGPEILLDTAAGSAPVNATPLLALDGRAQLVQGPACSLTNPRCLASDDNSVGFVTVDINHHTISKQLQQVPGSKTTLANSPLFIADLDGDQRMDVIALDGTDPHSWRYWLGGQLNQSALMPSPLTTTDTINYNYVAPIDGTPRNAFVFRQGILDANSNPVESPTLFAVSASTAGSVTAQVTTLAAGDHWTPTTDVDGNTVPSLKQSDFYYLFVDLNGDGNAEAIQINAETGGQPSVAFNVGAGFAPTTLLPGSVSDPQFAFPAARVNNTLGLPIRVGNVRFTDLNGDGILDVLVESNSTPVAAYVADGAGGVVPNPVISNTSGKQIQGLGQPFDFDGDGAMDFFSGTGGLSVPVHNFVYRHAGKKPDQLTKIHDGRGKEIVVTYKALGDHSVYTPANDCTYPQNCTNRGMWVVSEFSVTADWTPAVPSAVNKYSYTYAGGRSDLRGRGWLGFETQTVTDEQTQTVTTTTFDNGKGETDTGFGYPKAGLPTKVVTTVPLAVTGTGGTAGGLKLVSTNTASYEVSSFFGAGGLFARPHSTELLVQQIADGPSGTVTTTISDATTVIGYDGLNNVDSRTTTWSSGESRSYSAQYTFNMQPDKRLLSLLQATSETSTIPGQALVTRSHAYDPDVNTGLMKDETTQPNGDPSQKLFVQYDRNTFGQVKHVAATATDPLTGTPVTRETFTTYDTIDSTFPASSSNALGHTTRTVYHPGLGFLAFAEDPNGVTTHAQVDGLGRPRSHSADGRPTSTIHYLQGVLYGNPAGPGFVSTQTDDGLGGDVISTIDVLGNEVLHAVKNHDGTTSYVETIYSQVRPGQVAQRARPHAGMTANSSMTYQYDTLGRPTVEVLPDGNTIQTLYNGRAMTVIDPKQFSRTRISDELGRVVRVDENSVPDTASDPAKPPPATAVSTSYAYGPFGVLNQVAVTPRGASTPTTLSVMRYDDLGRRFDLLDADRGESVTTYNAFGDVVTDVDANGQMHIQGLDVIGRATTDFSTQDGSAFFQWDTAPHGVGMLGSATSADNVTMTYGYDNFSRPVETTWTINGTDFTVDRGLDPSTGQLVSLQYPAVGSARFGVSFGFDALGLLKSVGSTDPSTSVAWGASTWEADGQVLTETFGQNGQTARLYDSARAWETDITTITPTETIQQLHFGHDASGNVTERDDSVLGTTESSPNYDFLNRLTTWNFTSLQGSWQTAFGYDDLGDLRSRATTGAGGTSVTYGYGTRDAGGTTGAAGVHAATTVGTGSYGYDAMGNQLSGPGRKVQYTSFGLPKKVTLNGSSTSFKYDVTHARALKRSPGGASIVSAGGIYEKRTDTSGTVTHVFFVPGAGRTVAQVEWATDSSGAVTSRKVVYLHDDHLGSIESISGDGVTTQRMKYDPFGRRINALNPTKSAKAPSDITDGFTDQHHDDDLGIINMRGRIYDAQIGRFMSADPLVFAALVSSQGFNRYSYVLNNPLTLTDPSGFLPREGNYVKGTGPNCATPPGYGYACWGGPWDVPAGVANPGSVTPGGTVIRRTPGTQDQAPVASSDSDGPATPHMTLSFGATGDDLGVADSPECPGDPRCVPEVVVVAKPPLPDEWVNYNGPGEGYYPWQPGVESAGRGPGPTIGRIKIYSRPIKALSGFDHLYLFWENGQGRQYIFEGGPARDDTGASSFNRLFGDHGNLVVDAPDNGQPKFYDNNSIASDPSVTVLTGPSAVEKLDCLLRATDTINSWGWDYHPWGPNSNTAARQYCELCDIPFSYPSGSNPVGEDFGEEVPYDGPPPLP
jgi:RHS repeat-associated protein